MRKNILAIGISALFIISVVSPIVFGINIQISNKEKSIQSSESNEGPMDSSWPMFQQNLKHTGRSPYGKSGNWRVVKWKYKLDGSIRSSPAIDENGTIYIGGCFYFYSINPDGSLNWKYGTTSGWVESAASIDEDGTIYFGTARGETNYFYSLNSNGTLKWRYRIGHHVISPSIIGDDGTIYFGSHNENIYALFPNGTLRWKYKTNGIIDDSLTIDDKGILYCGSNDHYLYAMYPNNGTIIWKYDAGCRIGSAPTIADDGTIYFGRVEQADIVALYSNGTFKWKRGLGSNVASSPALAENGTIYIAAYKSGTGAYIYSINPNNGTVNWRYEVEDEAMSASPAIDKFGTIYIGGWGGNEWGGFYALKSDGKLVWEFKTDDSIHTSAAIGEDGTIYFGSWDDYLYAIEPINDTPPEKPDIDGPTTGGIRKSYTYKATSTDLDGDNISYYFNWGDSSNSGWSDFVPSGTQVSSSHSWTTTGTYTVKVKAKDDYDMESEWTELTVTMPRDKVLSNSLILKLMNKFPLLEVILSKIINL